MSVALARSGAPKGFRGFLWSKVLDAMVGPAAAGGDLLVREAGVWTRKPIGTDGHYLKIVAGVPEWASASSPTVGGEFYAADYKAADTVITNATTGTTFVTETSVTLGTGTYEFSFLHFTLCHATPDLKSRITFSGTASEFTVQKIGIIEGDGRYFNGVETTLGVNASQTTTAQHAGHSRGTIKVTAGGVLASEFAQLTASPTPITIYAGASVIAWKLA